MKTAVRRTAAVAMSVALVGGAAGCGKSGSSGTGSNADPKQVVLSAFSNSGDSRSYTMALHLSDPTGSLLKAMTTAKQDPIPAAAARRLIAGTIKLTVAKHTAGKLSDVRSQDDGDMSLELVDGGTSVVALQLIAGDAYIRVDPAFVRSFGKDAADGFASVAQASPALAAGRPVKIPSAVKTLTGLASTFGATVPTPAASATVDPEKLRNDLKAALEPTLTVTAQGNDTYKATVQARAAISALTGVVFNQPAFGAGLGEAKASFEKGLSKVPDGTVDATVRVIDGKLSSLALDLESIAVLARKADPKDPVPSLTGSTVTLDETYSDDALTPPANAEVLDLTKLLGSFFGGASLGT